MNCDRPITKKDSMYSINATCELLGVHRNTLRNIASNLLPFTLRNDNGKKVYKGSDIVRYWDWAMGR